MIRPLQLGDLKQLPPLWAASHSDARTGDLQRIAEDAVRGPGAEHRALATADGAAVSGAVLFRSVAGSVGTGEIEAVAAKEPAIARDLLEAAIEELRSAGARLIVAEYADTPNAGRYAALLAAAGFGVKARIGDYFGDGVPLVIAVLDG